MLAWNRSGLAVVVCVAVLLRHLWPLRGTDDEVALGLVGAALLAWSAVFAAVSLSRRTPGAFAPHRETVLRLITAGTLLLALVGFVAAFAAA